MKVYEISPYGRALHRLCLSVRDATKWRMFGCQ